MKISKIVVFAALAAVGFGTGCATQREHINRAEGGPGIGHRVDQSTVVTVDAGLGAWHSVTVSNNIEAENDNGHTMVDYTVRKERSWDVPIIGPLARGLFGIGKGVTCAFVCGCLGPSVYVGPSYGPSYYDPAPVVTYWDSSWEERHFIRQTERNYGIGGHYYGHDGYYGGGHGSYVPTYGGYYNPVCDSGGYYYSPAGSSNGRGGYVGGGHGTGNWNGGGWGGG
ncbi:MAG: hypothetical protein KGI49_02370, partial [Patescibacteria group bacterium]|nr:hypothetical protein [Patescibacteria group bacterium]